jgi:hypothetical protein
MNSIIGKTELINWLLDGEPWVIRRALVDLLSKTQDDSEVIGARRAIEKHPFIKRILERQSQRGCWGRPEDIHTWWPKKSTTFWTLGMLTDFGLTVENSHLARAAQYVLGLQLPSGGFLGFEPEKAADCHTAILLEPLVKMGLGGDTRVSRAYEWLLGRQRLDGGWWCKNTGQPGGPREHEPSCPFATMFVLGTLAQRGEFKEHPVSQRAVEFLLDCWTNKGRLRYPGHDSQIGSGWEKLKYPFVDYRILKFLDVLSRFPGARKDPRCGEILKLLTAKADKRGRFKAESIVKVWADFDFGQKKEPSRWITLLAWRVMARYGEQGAAPGEETES